MRPQRPIREESLESLNKLLKSNKAKADFHFFVKVSSSNQSKQ